MAKLTFLGTGGAFSTGRRSSAALLIEAPDFRMLVEAGPAILQQLARAELKASDIEQVFVSHSHGDHTLGFPMLALSRHGLPAPLHIYAGLNTIATLQMLCTLTLRGVGTYRLNFCWHELSEDGRSEIEVAPGVTMRTAAVAHAPGVPTVGARWDFVGGPSITYITDTSYNATSIELARDSDLLIHEASYSAALQPDTDPTPTYHSTAQQAGEIARQAGCPRLALVHLGPETGECPDVLVEEARVGTDLEVIVPEDGERIRV